MKEPNSAQHSAFRIPHSALRRLLALVVAEVFFCSSILPTWASPEEFLRPKPALSTREIIYAVNQQQAVVEGQTGDGDERPPTVIKNVAHLLTTGALLVGGILLDRKVVVYRQVARSGAVSYFRALDWLPDFAASMSTIQTLLLGMVLASAFPRLKETVMEGIDMKRVVSYTHLLVPLLSTIVEPITALLLDETELGGTFDVRDIAAHWMASGLSFATHRLFVRPKEEITTQSSLLSRGTDSPRARDGGKKFEVRSSPPQRLAGPPQAEVSGDESVRAKRGRLPLRPSPVWISP